MSQIVMDEKASKNVDECPQSSAANQDVSKYTFS